MRRGAFRVTMYADPGFATAADGRALTVVPGPLGNFFQAYFRLVSEAGEDTKPFVDETSAGLMQRYGNRPLWTYGDYLFRCEEGHYYGTVRPRGRAPVRIVAIEREPQREVTVAMGSYGVAGCSEACAFATLQAWSPLKVTFALAPGTYAGKLRGLNDSNDRDFTHRRCDGPTAYFADAWDFERVFTTVDPRIRQTGWSPALQSAMLNFTAVPGMSRELVAFALGFPTVYGTKEQLLRSDRWEWFHGSGQDTIATFQNGVLASITPRGAFWFLSGIL